MNKFKYVVDNKKPLSIREFEKTLIESANEFATEFDATNASAYMRDKHTFDEWMLAFKRFMSF